MTDSIWTPTVSCHGRRRHRARRLRRTDMASPASSATWTRWAPKHTCTSWANRSSAGEIVEYLSTRLGLVDWRKQHPEIAAAASCRRSSSSGRPARARRSCTTSSRRIPANRVPLTWEVDSPLPPPETATYETDPRIAAHAGAARRRRARDPGLPGHASDGRAAPAGVRAHDRRRLPEHDLPDAVPRAFVHPLAARRSRHGARVPVAPPLPAAPAVAAPGAAVGAEVARSSVVPRRAARRVPERAPRADAPRSAADHRLARFAPERVATASAATTSRSPTPPPSSGPTSSTGSTDRSWPAPTAPFPPVRVVDVHFRAFMADPFATIHEIYDQLGLELGADTERRHARVPRREHHREARRPPLLLRRHRARRARVAGAHAHRYQDYFDVESEVLG